MRYTDEDIRHTITDWIAITNQREVRFLLHYCLGFYGQITKQIMRVIDELVMEDKLTWEPWEGRCK